jgi:hypothetical protein
MLVTSPVVAMAAFCDTKVAPGQASTARAYLNQASPVLRASRNERKIEPEPVVHGLLDTTGAKID